MTDARAMLDRLRAELATEQAGRAGELEHNRLVPMIGNGTAPLPVLAALGAEEHLIVASDRRSFLTLAARAEQPDAVGFFTGLGQGEALALAQLPAFTTAAGMSPAAVAAYQPKAGCQAYPAYLAWLALNAEPADVILAVLVNFAAWGEYCATVAQALRSHYGFADEACGFFDFFASPVSELEAQGLAAIEASLATRASIAGERATGERAAAEAEASLDRGRRYARLLQSYEMSFWNTLAADAEAAAVS